MRIAINTRFLLSSKMEGFGWFTFETTKRMVLAHPEHTFVFLFDRKFDEQFRFAKNVEMVKIGLPARHPILFMLWFGFSVPRALKKLKIDAFISPDGYLSLQTKIPQIAVIHDLNFEHFPNDIPWIHRVYFRYFFPKFARKASRIFTVSAYSKNDIIKTYGISENKIDIGYNGANESFKPLEKDKQEKTKIQFSNNNDYILFVGAMNPRKNLARLVEAFTNLIEDDNRKEDLVIVGSVMWNSGIIWQKNLSEKVKKRIHLLGHLTKDDLVRVTASAKVFAYIPYFEGFGIPMLEAMQSGIPVLAANATSLPEVGGDAVLYCDPFDVSNIQTKLALILNDENLRIDLSNKAIERAKLFSWDKTASKLWDCLVSLKHEQTSISTLN